MRSGIAVSDTSIREPSKKGSKNNKKQNDYVLECVNRAVFLRGNVLRQRMRWEIGFPNAFFGNLAVWCSERVGQPICVEIQLPDTLFVNLVILAPERDFQTMCPEP